MDTRHPTPLICGPCKTELDIRGIIFSASSNLFRCRTCILPGNIDIPEQDLEPRASVAKVDISELGALLASHRAIFPRGLGAPEVVSGLGRESICTVGISCQDFGITLSDVGVESKAHNAHIRLAWSLCVHL